MCHRSTIPKNKRPDCFKKADRLSVLILKREKENDLNDLLDKLII
jgi:hypothetical protein